MKPAVYLIAPVKESAPKKKYLRAAGSEIEEKYGREWWYYTTHMQSMPANMKRAYDVARSLKLSTIGHYAGNYRA